MVATASNHVPRPTMEYLIVFLLLIAVQFIKADDTTTTTISQIKAKSILIPNYDNPEHSIKVFDERVNLPLILICNITSGHYNLSWGKNGKDVSLDPDLGGRYSIIDSENKFVIPKPNEDDAGLYTCSIPEINDSQIINVVANVYFKHLPESMSVVEGEKLRIHCIAYGTKPEIKWILGNQTYTESSGRIMLKDDDDGIKNSILIITEATLDDQEFVNCTATNPAIQFGNMGYQEAETFTYIRVKGKLAALWPFIGICTEVFVLCAIILIYEKKRHRSAMDDSDDEQEKLKQVKK